MSSCSISPQKTLKNKETLLSGKWVEKFPEK
jgi:hypothetical protein